LTVAIKALYPAASARAVFPNPIPIRSTTANWG